LSEATAVRQRGVAQPDREKKPTSWFVKSSMKVWISDPMIVMNFWSVLALARRLSK
jgi:hypothetical protein